MERSRPERSETRRLSMGQTERLLINLAPELKSKLKKEAESKKLSLSLYINLILTGQEKAP